MIKKKIKYIIFLIFYLNFLSAISYENKIIVKIDNKVVTSYELKNKILTTLILSNEEINQNTINKTKPLVINSLIDLKIKENEITKFKIEISDLEVNKNLKTYTKGDEENFRKLFSNNKLNFEIFKEDLKTELAWRKLIFSLYNKKVSINQSELDLELQSILKDNNNINVDYRLSELMINFETNEDKNKLISEINEQIRNKGFESSVLKYSKSLNKNNKGDMGWVNSGSLSRNILKYIENLEINEITEPIISGNSILFIKITDKRVLKLDEKNIEALKKRILDQKKNQRFNLYSNSHLSKLKNLSLIKYQ